MIVQSTNEYDDNANRVGAKFKYTSTEVSSTGLTDHLNLCRQRVTNYAMKTYGGVELQFQAFLTVVDGGEWLVSRLGTFTQKPVFEHDLILSLINDDFSTS
jgi:hypothetical protein